MEQFPLNTRSKQSDEYVRRKYWEPLALGDHLRNWVSAHATRTAFVDMNGRWTYQQFDQRVDRLASGLHALGIRAGDRVLIQLPNGLPFVTACFSLFRLGAVPILALPALRENDIDALCSVGEPVAYLVPDSFLGFDHIAMAETMASRHPDLKHIITVGGEGPHTAFETLDAEPLDLPSPAPQSTALLLLSGGTTSTPKLIPRTHADYAYNAKGSAEVCELDHNTVYLAALPAAHNFPLACPGILGTLSRGGKVVLARTPGFDEAFPLIAREKVTITALVPALASMWIQAREWDTTDLTSLRLLQVGGARLEPHLAARIKPSLGCELQQVFGMAEGLLCFTRLDDPEDVVLNTQGRPMSPGDELRIVDGDGNEVAEGEAGELLVRGPYTIRGYYRAEEHNRQAFTPDGYYRSGDKVSRTREGNLVVVGRIKDQINRGGEKIAAAEVEEHLRALPEVRDAAVIGIPDARLGERICACVITDRQGLDLAGIHGFLSTRKVPRHKWPDQLETVRKWPLTAIGKVDKKALVASLQNQATSTTAVNTYTERRITISSGPMELAARLLQTDVSETATLYERKGEWSLGLGTAARIIMTAESITLDDGGRIHSWPTGSFPEAMASAFKAVPIRDWRAYGMARFELARILHGLPTGDKSTELLEVVIPSMEVRLRKGVAVVRALSADDAHSLEALTARMDKETPDTTPEPKRRITVPIRSEGTETYKQNVITAVKEIQSGAYHKVILSRRVDIPEPIDIVASYLAGRRSNTPARSFVLIRPNLTAAGFCPETVVEVSHEGGVSAQPLAGTRSLGRGPDSDAAMGAELQGDIKEIAEHAMSVKLAFNELEGICEKNSIHVSEFMSICRRGSVQHLGSRVCGQLRPEKSPWNAFQALFPAVTASGIPKYQAIDAIGRHERQERGLYSGSVMIMDSDGSLDAALVLRSFYQQAGRQWVQAGAGLVSLSTAQRELEETCEKLSGVSEALIAREHTIDTDGVTGESEVTAS